MNFDLSIVNSALMTRQAADEIVKNNDYTEKYGLTLTNEQATALVETRNNALASNGRIEFGGGVVNKIIYAFCDSPYISKQNYVETLQALTDIFYYYKNETLDMISDDELIRIMAELFNGVCNGSTELMSERYLAEMTENIREKYNRGQDLSD